MLVDAGLGRDSSMAGATVATTLEDIGFGTVWTAETDHDPFLPLALAADRTSNLQLGTSIAVAFARSPMTLANTAWDLQEYSRGRFILGLGTQIEAHITRRYSMPWSRPAARIRELVLAMRAIWNCWLTGERLEFSGEFYTHNLMTPFFSPSPEVIAEVGVPKIFLAGVGPRMTEVAGEVCDGFICHGFTTERYLREVTLPALARGRAKAGKSMEGFEIAGPPFVVTGSTPAAVAEADAKTRNQLAFYGSTPAYHRVLELHGWQGVGERLHAMSKQGQWDEMGELITDEMLDAFAIVADEPDVGPALAARYGDVVTRVRFSMPDTDRPDHWRRLVASLADR